jgi:Ribbon-helix-helix protein, copG family.
MGKDGKNAVRVTTTLSKEQYDDLERIAKKNGVAIAWIVRKAVEHAIEEAEGGPLLPLV